MVLHHLVIAAPFGCVSKRGKWKPLKSGNRNTKTEVRKRKYGNGSTETEVRKPKYGSEKKSRLSVFSPLMTHDCVC